MFKVIKVKDYEQMSDEAFKVMREVVKDGAVLGLATGSTPIGLYKRMIKDHKENGTSYKNVCTYNLDEYVGLPLNHRESYYTFMHTNLFNELDIKEENIHVPSGLGDIEKKCAEYDAEVMAKGGVDIQLLGIGSDGHIGFSEPGTPFNQGTHVAKLAESTRIDNYRFFKDLNEEVPTHACTMGPKTIMSAKKVLLLANGANKAKAIKAMLEGPVSEDCPASVLQGHKDVVVIVDEAAASLLEKY